MFHIAERAESGVDQAVGVVACVEGGPKALFVLVYWALASNGVADLMIIAALGHNAARQRHRARGEDGEDFDDEKFIDRVAAGVACKASVKAHDVLSKEEMIDLLEQLKKTKNPFACAHGRPTIISYSFYELEKMFKRIKDC